MSSFGGLNRVQALVDWTDWCDGTCGEIAEADLDDYWTIQSIPYAGYEGNLWSNWHDVIWTQWDEDGNADWEIRFSTDESGSSRMGIIRLTSLGRFTDQTEIKFRFRAKVWFSYSQVSTIARISLYDNTIGSVHRSWDLVSSATANQWREHTVSELVSNLISSHVYSLRLEGFDAWAYQKVKVLFEYVKVAAMKPYYSSLSHNHQWEHRYIFPFWWHLYMCTITSEVKWSSGAIYDMIRDHRPYRYNAPQIQIWDPCYVHEFRLEDNAYFFENWYWTTFPGAVGVTAEQDHNPEALEIEVWTWDPQLLVANQPYQAWVKCSVWLTGWFTTLVEAEVANQGDPTPPEPPGWPAEYITIHESEFYHGSASLIGLVSESSSHGAISSRVPLSDGNGTILRMMSQTYYDVIVYGKPPEWVQIWLILKIHSKADLVEYLHDCHTRQLSSIAKVEQFDGVPVTITFNRPLQAEEVGRFVETYGFSMETFRFTGLRDGYELQGQGTAMNNAILVDAVNEFVSPGKVWGFYRIDGVVAGSQIAKIAQDDRVLLAEFGGFLEYLGLGIEADCIEYQITDPFWYFGHYA